MVKFPIGRWEYYRYPSGIEVRAEYYRQKGRIKEELRGKLDKVQLLLPNVRKRDAYYLNQRFGWVRRYGSVLGLIGRIEEQIIDLKTDEVLAKRVDFSSGIPNQVGAQTSLRDFKIWLVWGMGSCPVGKYPDPKWTVDGESFGGWWSKFININGEKE